MASSKAHFCVLLISSFDSNTLGLVEQASRMGDVLATCLRRTLVEQHYAVLV